jgi:hypothetical protein
MPKNPPPAAHLTSWEVKTRPPVAHLAFREVKILPLADEMYLVAKLAPPLEALSGTSLVDRQAHKRPRKQARMMMTMKM